MTAAILFASRHYMITALLLSKHPRFAAALCLPLFKLLLDCLRDLPEFIQARCLRKRVVATVFELCIQTFPSQRPSDRKPYFEKSPMSLYTGIAGAFRGPSLISPCMDFVRPAGLGPSICAAHVWRSQFLYPKRTCEIHVLSEVSMVPVFLHAWRHLF